MATPPLWPHQRRAIERARDRYREGSRAICMVAPTGAGKTRIGVEIATNAARLRDVLWLAHRRELVAQARRKLPPGIRVATVQELVASGDRPPAGVVVFDEAHHYVADRWREVADHYADAIKIGLTATPERSDGRALGDLFDSLVVAAHYSELLAGGYIVDCDVFAPAKRRSLAATPGEALRAYGRKRQAIVFTDTVKAAITGAATEGGAAITERTPTYDRDLEIGRFLNGTTRTLWNVYTLTEGFDAPNASLCVLARGASHASTYLQMVGRVLRAAKDKPPAVVVDLVGSYHHHGHPTEDRIYSLEGRAISRAKPDPIWQCRECGWVAPGTPADRTCPSCGAQLPEPEQLQIERRRIERQERNARATDAERRAAYEALRAQANATGKKPGWADHVYRAKFGVFPPYIWKE